jgi:hypothetical protein
MGVDPSSLGRRDFCEGEGSYTYLRMGVDPSSLGRRDFFEYNKVAFKTH